MSGYQTSHLANTNHFRPWRHTYLYQRCREVCVPARHQQRCRRTWSGGGSASWTPVGPSETRAHNRAVRWCLRLFAVVFAPWGFGNYGEEQTSHWFTAEASSHIVIITTSRLSMSAEPLLLSLRSCVDSSSLASSLLSSEQFTFHLAAVVQVLHGLGYCLLIITVVIIIITTSLLSTVIIRITMVYFLLSSYSQWSNFYLSRGPAAVFFFFLLLRTGQTVQQLVCLTDCWFCLQYMMILTCKILEITS